MFEARCSKCHKLFFVFNELAGEVTIVCRGCKTSQSIRFARVHGIQFMNGERPRKAA